MLFHWDSKMSINGYYTLLTQQVIQITGDTPSKQKSFSTSTFLDISNVQEEQIFQVVGDIYIANKMFLKYE